MLNVFSYSLDAPSRISLCRRKSAFGNRERFAGSRMPFLLRLPNELIDLWGKTLERFIVVFEASGGGEGWIAERADTEHPWNTLWNRKRRGAPTDNEIFQIVPFFFPPFSLSPDKGHAISSNDFRICHETNRRRADRDVWAMVSVKRKISGKTGCSSSFQFPFFFPFTRVSCNLYNLYDLSVPFFTSVVSPRC